MIKKAYENIKGFITGNYLYLLFLLIIYTVFTYPLPYYIYTGGGLINVDNRIEVANKTKSKGSYNLCYVSEIQATIPTYLLSYVIPDWDMVAKEDVSYNEKENDADIKTRNKVYLNEGNNSAIIASYTLANKKYEIIDANPIIVYLLDEADTNLRVGDEIISVDNTNVNSREEILDVVSKKNIGDKVEIKVINKGKEYNRYANIINYKGEKILGISIMDKYELITDPNVTFNFKNSESGPSGGFMLSLALYDFLVEEDLTKGLKISGTGTIDKDGNVGEIDGVKYKLKGAVKKHSDIFFVPNGDNYKEAIKLKKKKNYDIDVVGVSTLQEAITYLKSIKK